MTKTCPTCASHSPNLHPAVQSGGEVQLCPDAFHGITLYEVILWENGTWKNDWDGTLHLSATAAMREVCAARNAGSKEARLGIIRMVEDPAGWAGTDVPEGFPEPGEELANELDRRSGHCPVEINAMHNWQLTRLEDFAEYTCSLCDEKVCA